MTSSLNPHFAQVNTAGNVALAAARSSSVGREPTLARRCLQSSRTTSLAHVPAVNAARASMSRLGVARAAPRYRSICLVTSPKATNMLPVGGPMNGRRPDRDEVLATGRGSWCPHWLPMITVPCRREPVATANTLAAPEADTLHFGDGATSTLAKAGAPRFPHRIAAAAQRKGRHETGRTALEDKEEAGPAEFQSCKVVHQSLYDLRHVVVTRLLHCVQNAQVYPRPPRP